MFLGDRSSTAPLRDVIHLRALADTLWGEGSKWGHHAILNRVAKSDPFPSLNRR